MGGLNSIFVAFQFTCKTLQACDDRQSRTRKLRQQSCTFSPAISLGIWVGPDGMSIEPIPKAVRNSASI
jgi:hypothetical protein